MRRTGVSSLEQDDADDHGGEEGDAGERQGEVHRAVLAVAHLVADRVALHERRKFKHLTC